MQSPTYQLAKTFLLLIGLTMGAISFAEVESVYIQSRLDPNAITITEVDIVFLYDQSLLEEFPQKKSDWYANRRRLTQSWGDAMDVISVFIPQGFDSETVVLPERRAEAVKVFIWGQHDASAARPVDVSEADRVTVYIDPFGIIVDPA